MAATEVILSASPADEVVDERRNAIVRVVADALHELGNTLGAARHYAEHADGAIARDAVLADLEEIRRALQRATTVTRNLGDSVRHEGGLRSGVSAPAVVARAAERLRRAGVSEVSYLASPAGDPLIVPTVREYTLETLVCALGGLGAPMKSIHLEVTTWHEDAASDGMAGDDVAGPTGGVAIRVMRDRANPGDDRVARNAALEASMVGGCISFHPDARAWHQAELRLPGVPAAMRYGGKETQRRAEYV